MEKGRNRNAGSVELEEDTLVDGVQLSFTDVSVFNEDSQ